MTPLRYEHFVLLAALDGAVGGQLPNDKLPIKGMVAALLTRRGLAEWVRNPRGIGVALKITEAGKLEKENWQYALTP